MCSLSPTANFYFEAGNGKLREERKATAAAAAEATLAQRNERERGAKQKVKSFGQERERDR
jgi:hypothetical protein